MNALKRDLIEKRSWPVVALLVVAVIAVPVLFIKQSPASGTTGGDPPTITTSTPSASPGDGQSGAGARVLAARERDPFAIANPVVVASLTSRSASATSNARLTTSVASMAGPSFASSPGSGVNGSTGSSTSDGPSTSSTTTTSTSTSTTSTTPDPPPVPTRPPGLTASESYRVSLAITTPSGGLDTINPLERLSVLPSQQQQLLVELGVLKGGHRVLFMVQPGTIVSGPGTCTPGPIDCQILSLAPNQTEQLATSSAAGVNPVALFSVTAIDTGHYRTPAAARTARRSASPAGQQLLASSTLPAISLFQYRAAIGAVVDLRTLTVGGKV